jgi:copper chaperone
MSCSGCVSNIERILGGVGGIEASTISLDKKEAEVHFDPIQISLSDIAKKLTEGGYPPEEDQK